MSLLRDDRALLSAFRAGERAALERVYWHYVEQVERLLRHGFFVAEGGRVSGAPPDLLADLVQEVFARAFGEKARLAYDGLRPYAPYLYTIARNLLTDRARKAGREVPLDLLPDEPPADAEESQPWAEPPVAEVVERYVASLDDPLRAIHEQRFVLGRSQAEACATLGLTRQQLRTREDKLRQGLAAALKEAGITI